MPKYNIIKLKHLSPLHIGTGSNSYEFSASNLHSDTLSSALAAVRAQNGKGNDTESFLNSFRLSSALPYYKDLLFLPAMKGKIKVSVNNQQKYQNRLKKVAYIESDLWNLLIKGDSLADENFHLKDSFLVNDPHFEKPFISQVSQRGSVQRSTDGTFESFYFDWTYFDINAGLFCITDAKDALFDELTSLFQRLGEIGIGTDKNVGGGKFEVEIGSITLPDVPDANHIMLLSLYLPTQEEIVQLHLSKAIYELSIRGGYMSGSNDEGLRHLRKRSIYMFGLGSLFPTNAELNGKVVDLAPLYSENTHPVYRSGRPFCLPIKV